MSIADVVGEAGSNQLVAINIDTAAGVRGAEIRLAYDTEFLDLTNEMVAAGSVWSGNGDTQVVANVDDSTGSVVIFISSANPLADVAGTLATLEFAISADGAENTATLDLIDVVLNEGAIPVSPAPQAGPDPTDGELVIQAEATPGSDTISGFVFADADGDAIRDPGEAIPGVTIRLINTANQTELETTTDDQGRYQFSNLTAGSYRIEQVQPLAFIDLSPNTLNVQLNSGQTLENQNFIERGLRAGQHYTRLLTTLVRPIDSQAWRSAVRQITVDANLGSVSAPVLPVAGASALGDVIAAGATAFARGGSNPGLPSTPGMIAEGEADERIASQFPSQAVFYASATHNDPFERERLAAIDAVMVLS